MLIAPLLVSQRGTYLGLVSMISTSAPLRLSEGGRPKVQLKVIGPDMNAIDMARWVGSSMQRPLQEVDID